MAAVRLSPFALFALLLVAGPASARAQPGQDASWLSARATPGGALLMENAWRSEGGRPRGRVRLAAVDDALRPRAAPAVVYEGAPGAAALAVGPGAALVAVAGASSVSLVRVPLDATGAVAGAPRPVQVARPPSPRTAPIAVVATPTPDGFTVIWQEQGEHRGGAFAYLVEVSADGRAAAPVRAEIGWAMADLAWDGRGYHLALFFDGGRPGDTRLCMVTLDRAGRPEQHPWWITEPQRVDEAQLVPTAEGIYAVYRGGPEGEVLRRVRADGVRGWGQPPLASEELGPLDPGLPYAVRPSGSGELLRPGSRAR